MKQKGPVATGYVFIRESNTRLLIIQERKTTTTLLVVQETTLAKKGNKVDFKNLNFTDFVRYILTGLNFILFVILFPMLYFAPGLIKELVSEASVLTILLFSMAVGYLMDMLKLYHFAPGFNKNKAAFRRQVSEILEIPIEQAGSYFSITSRMWDQSSPYNFERRRAEWMLILHTAAALFASLLVWIFLVITFYLREGFSSSLYVPVLIVVATFLLTIRLYRIGMQEVRKHDLEFLLIMNANKKKLKDVWKLTEKKVD